MKGNIAGKRSKMVLAKIGKIWYDYSVKFINKKKEIEGYEL